MADKCQIHRSAGEIAAPERDPLGRAPILLITPALLAIALLSLPLIALIVRTPWRSIPAAFGDETVRQALWLSVTTSTIAATICAVVGLPLAWLLARVEFRGRAVVRALVTVPLVLPPVVAGVALLAAFGRTGVIGQPLRDATGIALPYTTGAVIVAHTFVALPFFVMSVEGALRSADQRYDVAAATLGATRWQIFTRITLPLALPGVAAGLILSWARSLGEFGATITFAGNYPGTTQTMPLLVYTELQEDPDTARVLALILLAFCLGVLALLRERWWSTVR